MPDPAVQERARLRAFSAYVPPGAAALMPLDDGVCRWPLGDVQQDEFRFCRDACERGPYCNVHRRLAFRRSH